MLSISITPPATATARTVLSSLALAVTFVLAAPARGAAPDEALELLRRYDAVMSPAAFEANTKMTAYREDGSTRSYKMKVLKSGTDKLRALFLEPASAKGQEMLRNGDNLWLYMPNLKRAVRVASRDQFMGGDFNNADVLRVNYEADYEATLGDSDAPEVVVLELKARGPQVAYDRIKLWMKKGPGGAKDAQPMKAQFYAASGKLLRSAEFQEVKEIGPGWIRPSKIVMKNELQTARKSEMTWDSATLKKDIPAQRFVLDDLGR
jgi:outer membrane lipoprotein-sorting protein